MPLFRIFQTPNSVLIIKSIYMDNAQYVYCYQENEPSSLVMLKKHETIISQMFDITQSTYIWISQYSQLHTQTFRQVYHELQINLTHFSDFQAVFDRIKKSTNKVIVICNKSYSSKIKDELVYMKKFPNVQKIINFTYVYQNHHSYEVNDIAQIHGNAGLIIILKEQKDKGFAYKKLSNFISLKDQVWSSNMLIPTIYTMINQRTNQQQIIRELQKLIIGSPNFKKNDIINKKQFLHFMKQSLLTRQQIISWYTKQTFLYALINNLLRSSRHPTQIFFIQPYFKCLFDTIKNIYHEQIKNKKHESFVCYRGGVMNHEQFLYFQNNIGTYIQNLGFLSASLKKDIPLTKDYATNIYFTIEVDHQLNDPVLNFGYAFLQEYSQFPSQQQILFNPLNTFKIIDIKEQMEIFSSMVMKRITLKHICMKSNNKDRYEEDYEKIRKMQIKLLKTYRIQGHLLINNQLKLKGGISYWQKFLSLSKKPFERAQAYSIISFSQYFNHNYTNALKNIQQIQSIIKQEYGCNSLKYAQILNNKAEVLFRLLFYEESEVMFKQSLKISGSLQSQFGQSLYLQTLSNMSNLLIQSGKYVEFLTLFNNITEISQIDKDNDKAIVVNLLFKSNYGIFLTKMNKYSQALKCFIQNLSYFRTFLGDTHPFYFVTLHNIAKTYYNKGDLHQAFLSFEQCLQYLKKTQKQNEKTINHGFYYYILGKISKKLGLHKEQEVYFEKSIQIYRQNYIKYKQIGAFIPFLQLLNQYRKFSSDEARQMIEVEINSVLKNIISTNINQFMKLSNCSQVRLKQISEIPQSTYDGPLRKIDQYGRKQKKNKQVLNVLTQYEEGTEEAKKKTISYLRQEIVKIEQNINENQSTKTRMKQLQLILFYILQRQSVQGNIQKIVNILLRICEYYMKIEAKTAAIKICNNILSITKLLYKNNKQQYKRLEKYVKQKSFLYCQYENEFFITSLTFSHF